MRLASLVLIAALGGAPTFVLAQAPKEAAKPAKPAAPAPVSSTPERTTASFGDWVMRCENVGAPAKRVCEVASVVTLQGQANPIAQVAIGRPEPTGGKQMTVVLPTNIAFAAKPQIGVAKAGAAPIELPWQRCTPGGCFAAAPIAEPALAALGAETEPGRLLFRDAADRDVALPLSFRGLSPALEALAKEP